jgi:hypothetical protein
MFVAHDIGGTIIKHVSKEFLYAFQSAGNLLDYRLLLRLDSIQSYSATYLITLGSWYVCPLKCIQV